MDVRNSAELDVLIYVNGISIVRGKSRNVSLKGLLTEAELIFVKDTRLRVAIMFNAEGEHRHSLIPVRVVQRSP